MSDEKMQEFTLRIANANKTRLCVILYDMFEEYLKEAIEASEVRDARGKVSCEYKSAFHLGIRRARNVLSELIDSVNRRYEIGENLYQIYRFVERTLIRADVCEEGSDLDCLINIIDKLRNSYDEISSLDQSAPIMNRAGAIYTGMTYNRGNVYDQASIEYTNGYLA